MLAKDLLPATASARISHLTELWFDVSELSAFKDNDAGPD